MPAPNQTVVSLQSPDYTAPNRNEKEAARYLGITVEGLRTLRKQGRGPASYKIGRCVRFSLADLADFAESHRRPA
jgi:excisionase family DNA binding protein